MMDFDTSNDHSNIESDDANADGDGVWSEDIEKCFQEALEMYPPCGRRKHILPEGGGKMFGRNELIARYIQCKTGKSRTRKQVSSHIQVLARRKAKTELGGGGNPNNALPSSPSMSSTAIMRHCHSLTPDSMGLGENHITNQIGSHYDLWLDRPIATNRIRLVEFSAFVEYRNNYQGVGSMASLSTSPSSSSGASSGAASSGLGLQSDFTSQNQQQASRHPSCDPTAFQPGAEQIGATNNQQTLHSTNLHHNPYAPGQPAIASSAPSAGFNGSSRQQSNYLHLQSHHHYQSQHLNRHHQHHHDIHNQQVHGTTFPAINFNHGPHQHFQLTSGAQIRHNYIKMDYTNALLRGHQAKRLERINISQVQDKFPEIGGPDGLFQRCPMDAFFLVKFWADSNANYDYPFEDQNSFFGFSSHFETAEPFKQIICSTKACSYGHQVVEKVEKIHRSYSMTNGPHMFAVDRSPMCCFMIQFIKKLRQLDTVAQMNTVLENFTVLQVVTSSESPSDVLLCLAYVFEIADAKTNQMNGKLGPQYHVYKLTKD